MAWSWTGAKPLPELVTTQFADIYESLNLSELMQSCVISYIVLLELLGLSTNRWNEKHSYL